MHLITFPEITFFDWVHIVQALPFERSGRKSNFIVLRDPSPKQTRIYFVNFCFNLSSLGESDLNNQYPQHGFVCNFLIWKGIQLHFNCFWALFSHLCSAPKFDKLGRQQNFTKCKILIHCLFLSFSSMFKLLSEYQKLNLLVHFKGLKEHKSAPSTFLPFVA